jgi:hypothetical protein
LIIPTFPKLKKIPCRYTGFDDDDRFEIWDFRQLIVWMVPLAKPIYTSRSAYGLATASPETRYVNVQINNALKKKAAAFRLYRSSLTFSWHSVFFLKYLYISVVVTLGNSYFLGSFITHP